MKVSERVFPARVRCNENSGGTLPTVGLDRVLAGRTDEADSRRRGGGHLLLLVGTELVRR